MSKTFGSRKFYSQTRDQNSQTKDQNSTCTLLELKIKNTDMKNKYDNASS
jgi:hypothetical protein